MSNRIKYAIYMVTIMVSLYAAIGFANNLVVLCLFASPACIFIALIGIDIVRWVNNLDYQYNLSVKVDAVPKGKPPLKIKGIPAGMSYDEYLVSLNKNSLLD